MADSVFVAGRLVCNRTPRACRVNASEVKILYCIRTRARVALQGLK